VKKIGSDKFMNVGPRKCHGKWLPAPRILVVSELSAGEKQVMCRAYSEITNNPVVIPQLSQFDASAVDQHISVSV
jgi:hypothetical protein